MGVDRRTANACKNRLFSLRKSLLSEGIEVKDKKNWSQKEKKQLEDAIFEHGKDYEAIQKAMGTERSITALKRQTERHKDKLRRKQS